MKNYSFSNSAFSGGPVALLALHPGAGARVTVLVDVVVAAAVVADVVVVVGTAIDAPWGHVGFALGVPNESFSAEPGW